MLWWPVTSDSPMHGTVLTALAHIARDMEPVQIGHLASWQWGGMRFECVKWTEDDWMLRVVIQGQPHYYTTKET